MTNKINSEQLTTEASKAIESWRKHHNTPCRLDVQKGKVIRVKCCLHNKYVFNDLFITRFELDRGLTSIRWNMIGGELFDLYIKELSCHEHPQP